MSESEKLRSEIMRLMREDFDPTPPNWEGRDDWFDNAEEVADKIMADALDAAHAEIARLTAERDEARRMERQTFSDAAEINVRADAAEAQVAAMRAVMRKVLKSADNQGRIDFDESGELGCEIRDALAALPVEAKEPCSECGGTGTFLVQALDPTYDTSIPCPRCQPKGGNRHG